jgi:hypothetical protein
MDPHAADQIRTMTYDRNLIIAIVLSLGVLLSPARLQLLWERRRR